jgi:hypothetical protein
MGPKHFLSVKKANSRMELFGKVAEFTLSNEDKKTIYMCHTLGTFYNNYGWWGTDL